jgi:hypothetical protein
MNIVQTNYITYNIKYISIMPKDMIYPHDDAETTLVNLENTTIDEVDVYIGPQNESYNLGDSPFMNPFDHGELGYDGAVTHYKMYFYRRYLSEPKFRELTHELQGKRLAGWCFPRPSHGEVIINLLDAYSDGGDEAVFNHIESELDSINPEELGVNGFTEYEAAENALLNR